MGKIIILILISCFLGILAGLPLWAVVNLFLYVFHLPYHLTLLQAVVMTALLNVIHSILFGNKEG